MEWITLPAELDEIWCLTHDQHGDKRIWSFMQAFRDASLRVLSFDPLLEFAHLPSGVEAVFPVMTSGEVQFERIESAVYRKQIEQVRSEFDVSEQTHAVPLQKDSWIYYSSEALGNEADDGWIIRDTKEDRLYVQREGCIYVLNMPKSEFLGKVLLCCSTLSSERTVSEQVEKLREELPEAQFDLYEDGWIKIRIWETGGARSRYLIDPKTLSYKAYDKSYVAYDETYDFFGMRVDDRHFRKFIYNYSEQLGVVRAYIEKQRAGGLFKPPKYVYVADVTCLPLALSIKDRFGTKVIVDCHEWWAEQHHIWHPADRRGRNIINELEREVYAQCDARITVGPSLAERMSVEFGHEFKGIYTVCDFEENDNADDVRARLGLPEEAKLALFQGSLTSNRNLEVLMQATTYLEDGQHLVILGDGFEAPQLRKVLEEEGNAERCSFLGNVENKLLLSYTRQCDVAIVPYVAISEYYSLSMPNKFSEYYASKTPIVVDKTMLDMAKIVNQQGIGRVVDCSKASELGLAISTFLSDDAAIARVKERFQKSENIFSQQAVLGAVKEVLAKI